MPSIPESHRDLLDTSVGVLATVGPDGRPQQSVVWFLADGDVVRVSLNDSRQKTKNLVRNPVVDLLILDLTHTYRYLEIRGDAHIEPDPDYVLADQVGAKYGNADLRAHDRPGQSRVVITIRPTTINAVDMSGG
jgi:PPOX class probable F420-dependent enzyme